VVDNSQVYIVTGIDVDDDEDDNTLKVITGFDEED